MGRATGRGPSLSLGLMVLRAEGKLIDASPVCCRVEDPPRRRQAQAINGDRGQAGGCFEPLLRTGSELDDAEVGGPVEVAGLIVPGQAGDWLVAQVETAVGEAGRALLRVEHHLEDVAGLIRGEGVISREGDPGVVRIGRIHHDAAHDTRWLVGRVDPRKGNTSGGVLRVRRYEETSPAGGRPHHVLVALAPAGRDHVKAVLVAAEGWAGAVPGVADRAAATDWNPVTAVRGKRIDVEIDRLLIAVRVQ